MGVRENKVETYLDESIKALGGLTRKWVCPGRAGVTDRICIYQGHVFFAEVKTVDGKLSTVQAREIAKLRAAGAAVVVLYGRRDVDDLVYRLRNWLPIRSEG